ncbi:MAG TPA: ribonuclease P protein component [Candidatus Baltobacteraceae bacterium]|nr:ribonuclease P protein component [Candidatus Baltobacteraceae bacterium]
MRPYASLRRTAEFSRLRQRGRRFSLGALTVYRADPYKADRTAVVGITVGRPVGKAVVRNKVRRRVAAILQQLLRGRRLRMLVVARPTAAAAPFAQLRNELERALV